MLGEWIPSFRMKVGDRLGRYQIEQVPDPDSHGWGVGAFGCVYKAFDEVAGRYVALKVLRHNLGHKPGHVAAFQREGETLRALKGPGIPVLYAYDCIDGAHFLAQEWIDGVTLGQRRSQELGQLGQVVSKIDELGAILARVHKQGFVHRDVGWGNAMIGKGGEVALIDFGMALPVGTSPGPDDGYGNVYAISPEQAMRRPADPRDDLFALGAIAYDWLGGIYPFVDVIDPCSPLDPRRQIKAALAEGKVRVPPLRATWRASALPTGMAEAIDRAYALRREDRFANMDEFRREFVRTASLPTHSSANAMGKWALARLRFALQGLQRQK